VGRLGFSNWPGHGSRHPSCTECVCVVHMTTEIIPDSPNAWDSGRYDFPEAAKPQPQPPALVPQPASAVPAPILKQNGAIWLYHIAVGALALVSVLSVVGILLLAYAGRVVPGELTTLAATALGGLVAMVATQQAGGGNA
jgi:hypothetical protein